MKLFKFLHLGCKEATLRCLKQQEEPLSFIASMHLKMHMLLCKPCLDFSRQVQWIHQSITNLKSNEEISYPENKKPILQDKINEKL